MISQVIKCIFIILANLLPLRNTKNAQYDLVQSDILNKESFNDNDHWLNS